MPLNVEIKARSNRALAIKQILEAQNARLVGEDHQIDTYFKVAQGRLKLREGNIENALIHYKRGNQSGPKTSEVLLYTSKPDSSLKAILEAALDVLVVVDKVRAIYFIENVKFHVDQVQELGSFVEIEAIDKDGSIGQATLQEQCNHYMNVLGIEQNDLVAVSYSDLLLQK